MPSTFKRRFAFSLVLASAGQGAVPSYLPGAWIERELLDANGVATGAAAAFLNNECRPADMSGVSMFGVQKGHQEPVHLHILCRADHVLGVRYEVSVVHFDRGAYASAIRGALRGGARVGPFVFGLAGARDGLIVMRRLDGVRGR